MVQIVSSFTSSLIQRHQSVEATRTSGGSLIDSASLYFGLDWKTILVGRKVVGIALLTHSIRPVEKTNGVVIKDFLALLGSLVQRVISLTFETFIFVRRNQTI